jgi:trans-2,3-dihydro-3-hydroxyanthranilate isomerase
MPAMPRVPFVLVDVFAERPLEGNQLCVLLDSPNLPVELVQALAGEIGFSETTWVLETAPDRYRMRIFTPRAELAFAGHPSLGTAYVLGALGRTGLSVIQQVEAGDYPISVDLDGASARMSQGTATFGPVFGDAPLLAEALGLEQSGLDPELPPRPVSTGQAKLMVALKDPDTVRAAVPNTPKLLEVSERIGCDGIYVFALEEPGRALARLFAPSVGIAEDPATGSAAGPLAAHLFAHGRLERDLRISQGEQIGRPSTLYAEADGVPEAPLVWVAGGVRIVGHGDFDVPGA